MQLNAWEQDIDNCNSDVVEDAAARVSQTNAFTKVELQTTPRWDVKY